MKLETINIKKDVIIIGSGLAGFTSALKAQKEGSDVLIISKSYLGKNSSTYWSEGRFTVANSSLSIKDHIKLTLESGRNINDVALVKKLTNDGIERINELKQNFKIDLKSIKKGYRVLDNENKKSGRILINAYLKTIREREINYLSKIFVYKLLKNNNRVIGLVGFSSDNKLYIIKAKTIVLATGGYSGIYKRNDNPSAITGDGLALSATIGAKLCDMEFVQYFPLGLAEDNLPKLILRTPFPLNTKIINNLNENIISEKYRNLSINELVIKKRDQLSKVIDNQYRMEREVYLDFSQVSNKKYLRYLYQVNISESKIKNKRIKVAPITHYTMGGLKINDNCKTNINGLYAAGEVTGGIHGANRVGGNALTACLVFGDIAGYYASKEAKNITFYYGKIVNEEYKYINNIIKNHKKGKFKPRQLIKIIKDINSNYLGVIKSKKGLTKARHLLKNIENKIEICEINNAFQLKKFFILKNMLLISNIMLEAAYQRRESRGCHYRRDFPKEKENWEYSQKYILKAK